MSTTENRTWTRLSPADKNVELKTAQGNAMAEVVDVSFGGVALKVQYLGDLQENDPVNVRWQGSWMRGLVRHIEQLHGEMRLGIEWATSN